MFHRSSSLFPVAILALMWPQVSLGQNVVLTPLYGERAEACEPFPAECFNHCFPLDSVPADMWPEREAHDPYLRSFLYGEAEMGRMRVTRFVSLSENPVLGYDGTPNRDYRQKNDGSWEVKDANRSIAKCKSDPNPLPVAFRPKPLLSSWDGTHLAGSEKAEDFDYYLQHKEFIRDRIARGQAQRAGEDVLQVPATFQPSTFTMRELPGMILEAVDPDDYYIAPYLDDRFLPTQLKPFFKQLFANGTPVLEGYRIVEDYFRDPRTGELTSWIIGVGMVGTDHRPGQELFWFYYNEFGRWLEELGVIYKGEIVNYDYLFSHHLYYSSVETLEPLGLTSSYPNDSEWMLSLWAPVTLELWSQELRLARHKIQNTMGIPGHPGLPGVTQKPSKTDLSDDVTLYYSNGFPLAEGALRHGQQQGKWVFFYPDGEIQGVHQFRNDTLNGGQTLFWPNNTPYCSYTMDDNLIQDLERFYPDGDLMEQGAFSDGCVIGEWTYAIRSNPEFIRAMQRAHPKQAQQLPPPNDQGEYHFRVNYTHDGKHLFFNAPGLKARVVR